MKNIFRRSKPFIGLDINSSSVKLLTLTKNGRCYRIEAYAQISLPEGVVIAKEIKWPERVAAAIKEAVQLAQTPLWQTAVAIADALTITKIIQVDADLTPAEIEEEVLLEAAKQIPYPLEEIYLDFQNLGPCLQNLKQNNIVLIAAPAKIVNGYLNALSQAGLIAHIVEIESSVIAKVCRFLQESDQIPRNKTIAVVNIDMQVITIIILENDTPIFTRTELWNDISNINGENSALKASKTYSEKASIYLRELILQSINRGIQFYFTPQHKNEIQQIILAGSLSSLPDIVDAVQEKLKVPTCIVDPFAGMKFNSSIDKNALQKLAPEMTFCVGLALRGFDKCMG